MSAAPGLSVFLDLTFSVKHQTVKQGPWFPSGLAVALAFQFEPVRGASGPRLRGQGGVSHCRILEGEFTPPQRQGVVCAGVTGARRSLGGWSVGLQGSDRTASPEPPADHPCPPSEMDSSPDLEKAP